jgi:hypothetical protein
MWNYYSSNYKYKYQDDVHHLAAELKITNMMAPFCDVMFGDLFVNF